MPIHSLITLDQIECYQVLDGDFRAYVRGAAEIQAWGGDKERAIAKLGLELARREIPFDITLKKGGCQVKPKPPILTATQLALYPDTGNLLTCKCGVRFSPRINAEGDDPKKCSTCNRAGWSKLFRHVKSEASEVKVVPITRTRKERGK